MADTRWFRVVRWSFLGVVALGLAVTFWWVMQPKSVPSEPVAEQTPQPLQQYRSQNGLFELTLPEDWSHEDRSELPLQTTAIFQRGPYFFEVTYFTSQENRSALPILVCDFEGARMENSVQLGLGRMVSSDVRKFAQSSVPLDTPEGENAAVTVCSQPLDGGQFSFGWPELGITQIRFVSTTGSLTEVDLVPLYEMLQTLRQVVRE